jgi:hypothetical protein
MCKGIQSDAQEVKEVKKLKFILLMVLTVLSIGCVVYAEVMQCVLCYEKYGVIFNSDYVFIPDKSAWGFLGLIGLIPIAIMED